MARSDTEPFMSPCFLGDAIGAMLEVHLDSWLREFGPRGNEKVDADSVEHLLDVLEGRYPRLRFKLRDETGQLRRYVRVFVDGEDVSGTTGVGTSLAGARTIDILHSIAGG
jgi:sulfur-carrier protein